MVHHVFRFGHMLACCYLSRHLYSYDTLFNMYCINQLLLELNSAVSISRKTLFIVIRSQFNVVFSSQ